MSAFILQIKCNFKTWLNYIYLVVYLMEIISSCFNRVINQTRIEVVRGGGEVGRGKNAVETGALRNSA